MEASSSHDTDAIIASTSMMSTASSDTSGHSSTTAAPSTASTADTSTNGDDIGDDRDDTVSSHASSSGTSSSSSSSQSRSCSNATKAFDSSKASADSSTSKDIKDKGKGKQKEIDTDKDENKGKAKSSKEKDKEKEKIEVLAERDDYKKELRTSSKGRKYLIETKGLWTTLRSLTPIVNQRSLKERLMKRLKEFATVWPFLLRFAKEVINLGKWRFLLHLIASTITGLTPALRIWLSGRLIAIAQDASDRKAIDKAELLLVAGSSYLSSFVESWIDSLLANNNGILQRRFQAMVSEHLISARARLDVHTLGKSRVMRDFSSASSLVHALGDGTFVIGQLIDLFTIAVSLATQASMLWSMTSKDTADLAMISVFSSSLTLLRWAWRRRGGYSVTSITDGNYNRMNLMEELSYPDLGTFGERKVLGLGDWVYDQYKKASNALGDVSLAEPWSTDPFTSATDALRAFSDTAIIVLFALKVSEKPIGEATLSMSSLTFIQSATRNLTSSLLRFIYDVQHFGDELSAYKSYYRVLEIKSAIKEPEEPLVYKTVRRTLPSKEDTSTDEHHEPITRAGMEVEFKNVSYTWPGRKEKALDGISFKINAGELTAVVGYNGAGKSTIIALVARLCDPNSGEILINGHDIRSYKTSDLHQAMSFLFQSSADLPLTIQEYIGVGNLAEINNLEKIRKAATDSGATEFIDKLEEGFQSSFTGQVSTETPDTMYKDAVSWDAYLDESDDDDSSDDGDDNDTSDSDSDSGSDSGSEAGGEKQKKKKKRSSRKSKKEDKEEEVDEGKARSNKEADADTEDKSSNKTESDDESDTASSHNSSDSDSSDSSNDSDNEGRLAFSGGQRQKLILARSFLRDNCDLAIFDEYSANLDPLAEHELFTRITANRGKQTLLYITHRYSTVRHADRILMLEKGKVIESGTHEELMAIPNGKYAEMSKLALGEVDIDKKKNSKQENEQPASDDKDKTSSADQTHAVAVPLPLSRPTSPVAT